MEKRSVHWRRSGIWLVAIVLSLAVAYWGINTTGIPMRVARTFIETVETETGWDVELGGAHLVGMTKLRLTDVVVRGEEGRLHGELPVVDLSFHPAGLWIRRGSEPAVGSVRLVRPRFTVDALGPGPVEAAGGTVRLQKEAEETAPQPSQRRRSRSFDLIVADGLVEEVTPQAETVRLWRVDGRMEIEGSEGSVVLRQARLKQVGGAIEATLMREPSGEGEPRHAMETYRWQAKGPAEFFLGLLGVDRWQVTGTMTAEGTFSFTDGAPKILQGLGLAPVQGSGSAVSGELSGRLSAVVSQGELSWGGSSAERAAFDTLELQLRGEGDVWTVDKLTLRKGEAAVQAAGQVGTDGADLELTVNAKALVFPQDLPILQRFGLRGKGEFEGAVTGTLSDPALTGKLTLRDGAVWHRPVTRGEGVITLTSDGLRIHESLLERGFSTYVLSGEIEWASQPGSLRLVLDARRGALDELLKAFAVDVDATGQIDGTISVRGPLGNVEVAGDVHVSETLVGEVSYFDQARGKLGWRDGVLTLEGMEVQSGDGVAHLGGTLSRDNLALDVTLTRWPLAAGEGALASLSGEVAGWANYRGRLGGTIDAPRLDGELFGGEFQVGRLFLTDPRGAMSLTLDAVELADLSLVSVGQGRYRLNGSVRDWREKVPTVALDVNVDGASLTGLLRESGVAVPAWLFDGRVDGNLRLEGEALKPDASFDLALADDLGVGEPIRLQFGLQDGKLKLSRSTLQSVLMNAARAL